MRVPFFGVNAFAMDSFSGNPAGVCVLKEWLSTDELQSMSAQLSLPEIAFVIPVRKDSWSIRWFSGIKEIDLCGHATLAAAHAIFKSGRSRSGNQLSFSSKSGRIDAIVHEDRSISTILHADSFRPTSLSRQLVEGLGAYPERVWIGDNYMCLFDCEEKIHSLKPDFTTLLALRDCTGVIVTSLCTEGEYDFISRYFAPAIGINEDHATGSAHCMLVPFWAKTIGKSQLFSFQASPRGAELYCEDLGNQVSLRGKVHDFFEGELIF